MRKIVIVGASGHGGMLLDIIEKEGRYQVIGFVDSFKEKGSKHCGYEVLGSESDLPHFTDKFNLYGAILAIGNNWTRKVMAEKIGAISPRLKIVNAIHPKAIIGKNVTIGKGSVVMAGAIINPNSCIGKFCILNTNASLGHDGIMEDYSSIASGVCTGGNLVLGRFSGISLGANVIENITIGAHSIVGAGSLVVKDVRGFTIVYGSPARFVRRRNMDDPYLNGDTDSEDTDVVPIGRSGS